MKTSLFVGICLLASLFATGQKTPLTVNAGNDTSVCTYSTTMLGGTPAALGGNPPYTYCWWGIYTIVPGYIYSCASDILNDTTLANPTISGSHTSLNSYVLHLLVTDSQGDYASDAVLVLSPHYTCLGWTPDATIHPGDSTRLFSVCEGGYEPQTYLWNPPGGLSDPTDVNTYASPAVSTVYMLDQWDSCNCSLALSGGSSGFIVNVVPYSGISQSVAADYAVVPNPSNGVITVKLPGKDEIIDLEINDLLGKEVFHGPAATNSPINLEAFTPGTYIVRINSNTSLSAIRKLIIY